MAINRRELLTFFSAAGFCAALPTFANGTQHWVIGACRRGKEEYAISACDLAGNIQWQQPIPSRGHDIALHESLPIGIAVARRPDQWLQLFDIQTGKTLHLFSTPKELALNGHAVWCGNELIVTASRQDDSTLRLLRYKLMNNKLALKQITAFSHVGPHELIRYKETLWIAIGGLRTNGRDVLNKEHFESGLLTLNANTLETVHYASSPAQHVSLRHLSANEAGQLFIAGQYQLDTKHSEPLLYSLEGESLAVFPAEPKLWPRLNGYLGSILAVDDAVVVTSPRSHWLGVFDVKTKNLQSQRLSHDICALAQSGETIIAGTGTGKLWIGNQAMQSHVVWDNHFQVYKG